jgi:hypothetical protein
VSTMAGASTPEMKMAVTVYHRRSNAERYSRYID